MDVGFVVRFEPSCVVPDDPGEVVRGARRFTPEDRDRLREQMIARLLEAHDGRSADAVIDDVETRVRQAMRGWRAARYPHAHQ